MSRVVCDPPANIGKGGAGSTCHWPKDSVFLQVTRCGAVDKCKLKLVSSFAYATC